MKTDFLRNSTLRIAILLAFLGTPGLAISQGTKGKIKSAPVTKVKIKAKIKAVAKPAVRRAKPAVPSGTGNTALTAKASDRHRFTLITVEEKVNSLKEKVFRSKAQLLLLQETLLHGVISTSKLKITHNDQIGSSFYLMSAAYSIDGTPIFSRSDQNGSLNKKRTFMLFQGSIRPGPHRLSIELKYRGNGFGIFSYLRGYRLRIRTSYAFTIQEGKAVEIKVQPFQRNWTYPLRQRIKVRYKVKVRKLLVRRKKLQNVLKKK